MVNFHTKEMLGLQMLRTCKALTSPYLTLCGLTYSLCAARHMRSTCWFSSKFPFLSIFLTTCHDGHLAGFLSPLFFSMSFCYTDFLPLGCHVKVIMPIFLSQNMVCLIPFFSSHLYWGYDAWPPYWHLFSGTCILLLKRIWLFLITVVHFPYVAAVE